jgi:hypothetical protein
MESFGGFRDSSRHDPAVPAPQMAVPDFLIRMLDTGDVVKIYNVDDDTG